MTTRSCGQIKRLDCSTRRPWKYDVDAKKPRFETSQIRKLDEISRFLLETGSAVQPPKSGGGIVLGDFLEWNSPSFHLINSSGMSGFYGFYGFSGFFRIFPDFPDSPDPSGLRASSVSLSLVCLRTDPSSTGSQRATVECGV